MPPKKDNKQVASTIEALKKQAAAIGFNIMNTPPDLERIPTGIPYLDYIIGGGYPRGRVTEIFGPPGSSKSTMAKLASRECILNGGYVCYIDAERSFSVEWANKLGLPLDLQDDNGRWMIDFPWPKGKENPSQEDWFSLMTIVIESGLYDMVIADTFGIMMPRAEGEAGFDKGPQVGVSAKNTTRFWKRITNPLAASGTVMLVINQERANIGDKYHPTSSPGGMAHHHQGSIQIQTYLPKTAFADEARTIVNEHQFRFYVRKTKVSETTGKLHSYFLVRDATAGFYEVDQSAGFYDLMLAAELLENKEGAPWNKRGNAYFNAAAYGYPVDALPEDPSSYNASGSILLGNGQDNVRKALSQPQMYEAMRQALTSNKVDPSLLTLEVDDEMLEEIIDEPDYELEA